MIEKTIHAFAFFDLHVSLVFAFLFVLFGLFLFSVSIYEALIRKDKVIFILMFILFYFTFVVGT